MNPETQHIFEQLVVKRGLMTAEELAAATDQLAQDNARNGRRQPLLDFLLATGEVERPLLRDLAAAAAVRSGAQQVHIGGFELHEQIGRGGMGAVYRATQVNIGRTVAVKLMRPKLARERRHLERFLREARASAKLSHPNIVQGIDAGQDKGYYYFAMEYVDGDSLRKRIGRDGALPEDTCIDIGAQMARALEHAAKFGMVHRDVKPENIFIEHASSVAKLGDLGLVKSVATTDTSITQTGVALGTPNYISPEQARGDERIDIRTDIYSLGATLYHAATGTLPFKGDSAPVIMSHHLSTPIEPPHQRNPKVSVRFSRVIQKMMAKKPEHRYQTPAELREDLERVGQGEQPLALQTKGRHRRRRTAAPPAAFRGRGWTAAVIGGSIAALALAVALVLTLGPGRRSTDRVEAGIRYRKAVDLVRTEPTSFEPILEHLDQCLALDPTGPLAPSATALRTTVDAFRKLARSAKDSPPAWAKAAASLKSLADTAPKDTPCAQAIGQFLRTTSRDIMAAEMRRAVADPTTIPRAAAWLDAIAAASLDPETARQAQTKQDELRRLLSDSADHILDRFARKAKKLTEAGRFGDAMTFLQNGIPKTLNTPMLQRLLDQRVDVLRGDAARYLEKSRVDIWALLDGDAQERAHDQVQYLEDNLGVPALAPQVQAIRKTVDRAKTFLPLLVKLKAIDPKDETAVAAAALALRKKYGGDPYVADRLRAYQGRIGELVAERRIDAQLKDAAQLIADAKKIADPTQRFNTARRADQTLDRILSDKAATDAQVRRATQLQLDLGPQYGLIRILAAALTKQLPARRVRLRLDGRSDPDLCDIIAVSKTSITLSVLERNRTLHWHKVGHQLLYDLARGRLKLVSDADARGLFYLGAACLDKDNAAAKLALDLALARAKALTDTQLPGRAGLIRSAELLLARLHEDQAQAALVRLGERLKSVCDPNNSSTTRDLEAALAAWDTFGKRYAASQYVKANTAKLKALGSDLTKAIVRIRANSLLKDIGRSDWAKLVPCLEKTLEETDKVVPLERTRRDTFEKLIRYGKAFIAEEIVYREVFGSRPWRGPRTLALKHHANKTVAARADRYSRIFNIEVQAREDAAQQQTYVSRELHGEEWVSVRDPDTRLARCNAVFTYWRKDRDACAWAEVEAASEFRNTGFGGNMMTVIMMENFVKYRRSADKPMRAQAEYVRLQAMIRSSRQLPVLRTYAISRAKRLIGDYRGVDDFPARFCLMAAEQSEAAGDYQEALKFFEKLIDAPQKYRHYTWQGYLGRGRTRERQKQYMSALFDYETAFRRSKSWNDGHRCAQAIVNLCVHSGKLKKRTNAERVVNELLGRSDHPRHQELTRQLLKK